MKNQLNTINLMKTKVEQPLIITESSKNLASHRNQAINLQCNSVNWSLPETSFHRKGLLINPKSKNNGLFHAKFYGT